MCGWFEVNGVQTKVFWKIRYHISLKIKFLNPMTGKKEMRKLF